MSKTEPATPRRRRTEGEIAQGRHDIAARKIEHLTEQRDRLHAETARVVAQLAEQVKVRDFYAGHPDVAAAATPEVDVDPAQMAIDDEGES